MTDKNSDSCFSGASNCCSPGIIGQTINMPPKRKITIDFLYLDLSICIRCQGTDNSLDEALAEVAHILQVTNMDVVVNKINVNTTELAERYQFLSSPTIRINGMDIQMDVQESLCESCGDLCGDQVDCRVWVYQGHEYTVPPKGMIIEAILKSVYGGQGQTEKPPGAYVMPKNLRNFFAAIENKG